MIHSDANRKTRCCEAVVGRGSEGADAGGGEGEDVEGASDGAGSGEGGAEESRSPWLDQRYTESLEGRNGREG